jgi:hypothetical protein
VTEQSGGAIEGPFGGLGSIEADDYEERSARSTGGFSRRRFGRIECGDGMTLVR